MKRIVDRSRFIGFSLAEAVIGIGMAAVLILSIIAITTAALSGDQKAEMRQIALVTADSELNRFARSVAVVGSSARDSFWSTADSTSGPVPYAGAGARSSLQANRTDFELEYQFETVGKPTGSGTLGDENPDNRLRKVDLTVSWWNGEQGKPGYGRLSVTSTRLVRESDLREPF
jgi:hypothetical protein